MYLLRVHYLLKYQHVIPDSDLKMYMSLVRFNKI